MHEGRRSTARALLTAGYLLAFIGSLTYFIYIMTNLPAAPARFLVPYGFQLGLVPLAYIAAALGWWLLASVAESQVANLGVMRRASWCLAAWVLLFGAGTAAAQLALYLQYPASFISDWELMAVSFEILGGLVAVGGYLVFGQVFVAPRGDLAPAEPVVGSDPEPPGEPSPEPLPLGN
jgi:hypothetical protein